MSKMSEKDIKRKNGDMSPSEERKLIWIPKDDEWKQVKLPGRKTRVEPIFDHNGNIANPKEISTQQYIKLRKGGPCKPWSGPTLKKPTDVYNIINNAVIIKAVRQAIKDIISTNAFHDKNVDELIKKMDMQGNADEWEYDIVKQSADLLKNLGMRQKENLQGLLRYYFLDKDADQILEMLRIEAVKEKKKKEVIENDMDKGTTKDPRAA